MPSPGDKTLLVAGFLAGKGLLSPWAVMAVGTSASFLGCATAYGLGIYFGHSLLPKIKWLRLTPERFTKLELFFGMHGAKAVFYARLVALLHPVTGFVAGSLKTPWWPFLLFNFIGTLTYVTCYSLSGRFLWQTWELHKNDPVFLAAYLCFILGGYLLLAWYLRRALRSFFAVVESNPK